MHVFLIVAVITAAVAFASSHPPDSYVRIPMEQAFPKSERSGVHNVGDGRTILVKTWAAPAAAQRTDGSSEASSRSAQEAAASRHLASLAPAPPEPGYRLPAFQTLDGEPPRLIFDTSAAGSSTGPPGTRQIIPQFQDVESGRVWGPLPIGNPKFSMKSYPLDIEVFHHLYGDTHAVPADFEDFVTDRPIYPSYQDAVTFPNQPAAAPVQKRIDVRGTFYRPEPAVLQAVHNTIWNPLSQYGIRPQILPESDVLEGEYLWPPVEANSDNQHLFPISSLLQRFRTIISSKFQNAVLEKPSLFHLNVDVNGQIRHILMFPVISGHYVEHTNTPHKSKLWLLYEGMTVRQPGRQQLSLLGATYLPKKVHSYLQDLGVLRVAFSKHMNVLNV